jgi:hypothetical protein
MGTWSGFEIVINDNFDLMNTYSSSDTVLQNLSFTRCYLASVALKLKAPTVGNV